MPDKIRLISDQALVIERVFLERILATGYLMVKIETAGNDCTFPVVKYNWFILLFFLFIL
jgi:hypothetical protein